MTTTRSATHRVLGAVRPSEDRSLASIARASGVPLVQARQIVTVLTDLGLIRVERVKQTGKRGRPAHLYRKVVSK